MVLRDDGVSQLFNMRKHFGLGVGSENDHYPNEEDRKLQEVGDLEQPLVPPNFIPLEFDSDQDDGKGGEGGNEHHDIHGSQYPFDDLLLQFLAFFLTVNESSVQGRQNPVEKHSICDGKGQRHHQ